MEHIKRFGFAFKGIAFYGCSARRAMREDDCNGKKNKKIMIIIFHAFLGWVLCAAVMGIGMGVTTQHNALVIHALAAPVIFGALSLIYFTKFDYTTPLQTALMFLGFVIFMDFFLIAFLILKSFDMFKSILGTWIPFLLIFLSTYLTGRCVRWRKIH
jgi:hypothetical protein